MMGSKDIKCRRLLSTDPDNKDFGKVCGNTLASLDDQGRICIVCPICGKTTYLMVRQIEKDRNKDESDAERFVSGLK